jgi:hypothetical protein
VVSDSVGSTRASEQLDPEEWTGIVNGVFDRMMRPVFRYEGNVARLMGDAILAFFGAPIAHEEDPQRAVLAGLDMVDGIKAYGEVVRRELGVEIDVRVGINTGLVVSLDALHSPDNVSSQHIPHDSVLPIADLLVMHTRHGTVMAGVTFGVTMMCIPMGGDQPHIARRVETLGLRTMLDVETPRIALWT